MAKLTEKQRKFVLYYEGDATKAAIKAGYSEKTAAVIGCENLKKPNIWEAITLKTEQWEAPHVADVARRKVILTDIAEQTDHKDRVKAVDTLNKMDALYIQKLEDVTNYGGLSEDEVLTAVLLELESRGYKVIPPE